MAVLQVERDPPGLASLPRSTEPRSRLVTLFELPSGKYVDTLVRGASLKVKEITDELGPKPVFSGLLDIHQNLLGRSVKATGSINQLRDQLYFFHSRW